MLDGIGSNEFALINNDCNFYVEQIIRTYSGTCHIVRLKTDDTEGKDLKFSDMNEAIIYKIDKNGNTIKIAVYDNDIKSWIRK